jgi:hypothetical protein
LASGQSAPGFLEFMGSNAVQTGRVKISFEYNNDPDQSLIIDMHPCNMEVKDTLDGYPAKPCGCNYCEPACKPVDTHAYPAFFDGFNVVVVVIVYACLIVLSVIIYFVKRKWMTAGGGDENTDADEDDYKNMNDIKSNGSTQKNIANSRSIRKDYSTESHGPINKSSSLMSFDAKDGDCK